MPTIHRATHLHFECLKNDKNPNAQIFRSEGGKNRELKSLGFKSCNCLWLWKKKKKKKKKSDRLKFTECAEVAGHIRDKISPRAPLQAFKSLRAGLQAGLNLILPRTTEEIKQTWVWWCVYRQSPGSNALLFSELRCTVCSTAPCWHSPAHTLHSISKNKRRRGQKERGQHFISPGCYFLICF